MVPSYVKMIVRIPKATYDGIKSYVERKETICRSSSIYMKTHVEDVASKVLSDYFANELAKMSENKLSPSRHSQETELCPSESSQCDH